MSDQIKVIFGGDATDFNSTVQQVERGAKALGGEINNNSRAMKGFASEGVGGLENLAEGAESLQRKLRGVRAVFELGGTLGFLDLIKNGFKDLIDFADKDTLANDKNTRAVREFGKEGADAFDGIQAAGVQVLGLLNRFGEDLGDSFSRLVRGNDVVDAFEALNAAADKSEKKAHEALTTRAKDLGIVIDKEWDQLSISQQTAKILEETAKKKAELSKKQAEEEKNMADENKKGQEEWFKVYDEGIKKTADDQKKADDEHARALEEQAKAHEEIKTKVSEEWALQDKADEELRNALKEYAAADKDRLSHSLSEISKGGRDINPYSTTQARQVEDLEAQAKRAESFSKKDGDSNDKSAAQLQSRADKIRSNIRGLDSKDKDPMAKYSDAIGHASENTAKIDATLDKLYKQLAATE